MQNPIDKEKTTELPGLLLYPHHIGSFVVKPEDEGKLKTRALSAMREQTNIQLKQLQKQAELIVNQALALKKKVEVSEQIYLADMSFEPFVGNVYHLYARENKFQLMLIGPDEWGKSFPKHLKYINSVRLMSDHSWEIE